MTKRATISAVLRRLNPWRFKGMIHPNLYRERFEDMEYLPPIGAYLNARKLVALGFLGMGEQFKRDFRREHFKHMTGLPYRKSIPQEARDYIRLVCKYGGPVNNKSCCGGKCRKRDYSGGF